MYQGGGSSPAASGCVLLTRVASNSNGGIPRPHSDGRTAVWVAAVWWGGGWRLCGRLKHAGGEPALHAWWHLRVCRRAVAVVGLVVVAVVSLVVVAVSVIVQRMQPALQALCRARSHVRLLSVWNGQWVGGWRNGAERCASSSSSSSSASLSSSRCAAAVVVVACRRRRRDSCPARATPRGAQRHTSL